MARRLLVALTTLAMIAGLLAVVDPPSAHAVAGRSVMLVVDTSGSMGGTPLEQAKAALTASVDALDADDAAGLRSYGGGCGDGGTLLQSPATGNRDALRSAIGGLTAGGGTPTPDALQAGVGDFPASATSKILILVSDGQSTCGNPCPVAQQIAQTQGVNFKAYTVGFNAPDQAEGELQCIARVTGGTYFTATDTASLQRAINTAIGGGSTPGAGGVPSEGQLGTENPASNVVPPCAGDPVNCATGNFTLSDVDLAVGVRGPGLALGRTYNSLDASSDGPVGLGWSTTVGRGKGLEYAIPRPDNCAESSFRAHPAAVMRIEEVLSATAGTLPGWACIRRWTR